MQAGETPLSKDGVGKPESNSWGGLEEGEGSKKNTDTLSDTI